MKNHILIIVLIIAFTACDKEVSVDLSTAPERLIVEGRVERIVGQDVHTQQVVLSRLNDFFDQSQTPRVNDAQVSVADENGNIYEYTLDPEVPGKYINNQLVGQVGQTYTLTILWNDQVYEASETLIPVTRLEQVYQRYEESNAFEDGGLKVAIDFADPIDQENYYFWELFMDGQNLLVPDPGNSGNVIAKDELWNGQTIEGYLPNEELTFEPGEEVVVRHIGISKVNYDYLFLLFEQTGQTGQLIDVPPALIQGNIRNLTNPENIAMGYFGASEIDEEILLIVEDE